MLILFECIECRLGALTHRDQQWPLRNPPQFRAQISQETRILKLKFPITSRVTYLFHTVQWWKPQKCGPIRQNEGGNGVAGAVAAGGE